MKFLVAMCLLAAGVSANYGESGIVYPDGTLVQFTRAEADNIAEIGEAGVVRHDGTHIQFDREMAAHHAGTPPQPMPERKTLDQPFGYSGIMKPDGNNRQFTAAESDNFILVGPSGAVTADGKNVQFNDAGLPTRAKREVLLEGPSGVLFTDGQKRYLPRGVEIVLLSESGAVLSNGDNVQFRKKREVLQQGPSGVLFTDGQLRHLPSGVTVVLVSESGAVLSNGKNVQFRKKRSSPLIDSIKGPSGYITPTGQVHHLPAGVTVAIEGDTGALLSDGTAIQFFV